MRPAKQKVAEARQIATEMAIEAFKNRPFMDDGALRNYLITEEMRAGIAWNNHTNYQATYLKVYMELCEKAREAK